jgi:hypothetical protein
MIKAQTMIELRDKIYKREKWTRAFGESAAKRIKSAYAITKTNTHWIATRSASGQK